MAWIEDWAEEREHLDIPETGLEGVVCDPLEFKWLEATPFLVDHWSLCPPCFASLSERIWLPERTESAPECSECSEALEVEDLRVRFVLRRCSVEPDESVFRASPDTSEEAWEAIEGRRLNTGLDVVLSVFQSTELVTAGSERVESLRELLAAEFVGCAAVGLCGLHAQRASVNDVGVERCEGPSSKTRGLPLPLPVGISSSKLNSAVLVLVPPSAGRRLPRAGRAPFLNLSIHSIRLPLAVSFRSA